jgi:methylenetetrahydrofolate--tRNA-(uracil-5-)-methyltransferase
MTGVEGYVESAASGLMAGLHAARATLELEAVEFPSETAHGALANYISNPSVKEFQPMNVNFGLIPPLTQRIRKKREKNAMIAARALEHLDEIKAKYQI